MKNSYKCPLCGGQVFQQEVKMDLWLGEKLIVIENVPADVCQLCGEEAFSPKISKKIEKMTQKLKKPKMKTLVPVFSFA